MKADYNDLSLNAKQTDTFSDTTRTITKFEEVVLRDDWGRGRELFTKAVRGFRRIACRLKQWWMHRVHCKSVEEGLERYYLTEYKAMSASIRRERISRDLIRLCSYR